MSRRQRPDLPLFDLPLHGDDAVAEPAASPHDPDPVDTNESATGLIPSQTQLFADDRLGDLEGDDPDRHESGDDDPSTRPDQAVGDDGISVLDRLLGGLVDLSIHGAVLLLVGAATWVMGVGLSLADWPAFAVFLLLFSLLYTGVPLAFWGQTPGMMRVGHVARTGSGEPLTFGQTARRWLGALLTLVLAGLPLLLALGTAGRSLADRLSGSYTEPA